MKPVISAKDVEELLHNGGDLGPLPSEAILTPSALDLLRAWRNKGGKQPGISRADSTASAPPAKPLSSKSPKSELDAFFNSAYCRELQEQICDVGGNGAADVHDSGI